MKIKLTPILSSEKAPSVQVSGESISINGEEFDFSSLPTGYELPAEAIDSPWFTGGVEKSLEGNLTVNIMLPYAEGASENVRFPLDIQADDGVVVLPETQESEEAQENAPD